MTTAQKKVSISKPVLMADALKFASGEHLEGNPTPSTQNPKKTALRGSKAVSWASS